MSQSIERAIDVLLAVGEKRQTPAEISRRLNVLAELQIRQIVYIAKIEQKRLVRLLSRGGEAVCLHTAAVAKVIAYASPPLAHSCYPGIGTRDFNPETIGSRQQRSTLKLATVRERRWASDVGELEDYISCLGGPIRDASGNVLAAVSVTELKAISNLDQMPPETILEPLQQTAVAISLDLGAHPHP